MHSELANEKAFELRRRLFVLTNEFKDLAARLHVSGDERDCVLEARSQVDGVACQLARIHQGLPDLFVDATRDNENQEYRIGI
jgi:hypothetical protein